MKKKLLYLKPVFLLATVLFLIINNVFAQQSGSFTDSRDGQTYKWVRIGGQVWMAENLAYRPSSGNYWAYENNQSNVARYGYLYDWQTAQNVCPTGWHLPSAAEWRQLINFVGSNAGTKLKARSGWSEGGNGTDEYGFSALPGGSFDVDLFFHIGRNGYWWTATTRGVSISMDYNNSGAWESTSVERLGKSVRCVRD